MPMTTFVLNFGHPLSQEVYDALAPLDVTEISMSWQWDLDAGSRPTPDQAVTAIRLAERKVQEKGGRLDGTSPVILILPGVVEGAALLLAVLHGRLGRFPKILALRRGEGDVYRLADLERYPGMYGGVLELERVRQAAREVGRHRGEPWRQPRAERR